MAKKKITEIVEESTADFLAQNGLELYNSEFVKEGKDWFLRVYIDKLPKEGADGNPEEEYVSTDDCECVSRFLSAELDRLDPIEQNYYLEVSSPGLDRVLIKEKDFIRSMGKLVEIRTYRPVEKQKEFCGVLHAYDDNSVTIDEDGTLRTFDKKDIALIRLAIEF